MGSEVMLTRKQLIDMAKCSCEGCEVKFEKGIPHCIGKVAKTALALADTLKRLEWVEVGEREEKQEMIPAILCPSCVNWKEDGHKADCELAALLKESEVEG